MKTKDELIDWLRDAYAMEKAMELSLKKQLENEAAPMELREQASIHYVETQGHAEAVAGCLKRLGSDPSTVKTVCAEGLEIMKGLSTAMARDERVKDALAAYTAEHFEIACYMALRTAAQRLEEPVIVTTCDAILLEEMKMAAWWEKRLPLVVTSYLEESTPNRMTEDGRPAYLEDFEPGSRPKVIEEKEVSDARRAEQTAMAAH